MSVHGIDKERFFKSKKGILNLIKDNEELGFNEAENIIKDKGELIVSVYPSIVKIKLVATKKYKMSSLSCDFNSNKSIIATVITKK